MNRKEAIKFFNDWLWDCTNRKTKGMRWEWHHKEDTISMLMDITNSAPKPLKWLEGSEIIKKGNTEKTTKPITINLFGGPGTGKSTISAGIFSLLKMHDVNTELITEFAKDLTWEERNKTLSNQYYIWGKQYHRMWRVKNKVDVIVTDSPLPLSIIYDNDAPECFKETVLHSFNDEFDNMNYFLIRDKEFNPKGRNQTEKEAKKLDSMIPLLLHKYNVKFKVKIGSYESINDITKRILKRLNKTINLKLA